MGCMPDTCALIICANPKGFGSLNTARRFKAKMNLEIKNSGMCEIFLSS